jgi:hypothetical protein
MKHKIYIILFFFVNISLAQITSPKHFKMLDSSYRSNATIGIETSINPNINGIPLNNNDEIGVFNSNRECCGAVVWLKVNTALTAWGNDGVKKIGLQPSELYNFRIWQKSSNKEYDARAKFKSGIGLTGGMFQPNAVSILDSLVGYRLTGAEILNSIPTQFELFQNYPNPFNPGTKILFKLSMSGIITIEIIDIHGKVISYLVSATYSPGSYCVEWNGKDKNGFPLSSGIYFYRFGINRKISEIKKMMLIR